MGKNNSLNKEEFMKRHSVIATIIVFLGALISSWIADWVNTEDRLITALGISIVFYILDVSGFDWKEK